MASVIDQDRAWHTCVVSSAETNASSDKGGARPPSGAAPGFKVDRDSTYTKGELSSLLGVTGRAIEKWTKRRRGGFPRPFYIGRTPYWRGHVIVSWMDREQTEAPV